MELCLTAANIIDGSVGNAAFLSKSIFGYFFVFQQFVNRHGVSPPVIYIISVDRDNVNSICVYIKIYSLNAVSKINAL